MVLSTKNSSKHAPKTSNLVGTIIQQIVHGASFCHHKLISPVMYAVIKGQKMGDSLENIKTGRSQAKIQEKLRKNTRVDRHYQDCDVAN